MAIAAQEQITPDAPQPARSSRQPAAAWSMPSQLRKSLPIVRLIAEIWAIPQVGKVGVVADGDGIQVRVLMAENDRAARAKVYDAERSYLITTSPHDFNLRVSPIAKAGRTLPPPFETVLER